LGIPTASIYHVRPKTIPHLDHDYEIYDEPVSCSFELVDP